MRLVQIIFLSTLSILSVTFTTVNANELKCTPTPEMLLGEHYTPVTHEKINISKGIKISGKILSAKDCKPISNVKIIHWQANEKGIYEDKLRAYMYSNDKGKFAFQTEWPKIDMPHIHFIFEAQGYKNLTTQWVGEDKMKSIILIIVLKESE